MGCPRHPHAPRYGRYACHECRRAYQAAHNAADPHRLVRFAARHAAKREQNNAERRERYRKNRAQELARIARYQRNLKCLCACGRPVRRTGLSRSLWCSADCEARCKRSVCETLAAGLGRLRGAKGDQA